MKKESLNAKERNLDRKRKISQAAARVIAEKIAFSKTTVRDIAQALRISQGTLYYHFDSKEELLEFIFKEGWREVTTQIESRISSNKSPWEKMEIILFIVLRFFRSQIDLAKVFVKEPFPIRDVPITRRGWKKLRDIVEKIIEEAKEERLIPEKFKTRLLLQIVYGAVEQIIYGWVFERYYPNCKADYSILEAKTTLIEMLKGLGKVSDSQKLFYERVQRGIEGIEY